MLILSETVQFCLNYFYSFHANFSFLILPYFLKVLNHSNIFSLLSGYDLNILLRRKCAVPTRSFNLQLPSITLAPKLLNPGIHFQSVICCLVHLVFKTRYHQFQIRNAIHIIHILWISYIFLRHTRRNISLLRHGFLQVLI